MDGKGAIIIGGSGNTIHTVGVVFIFLEITILVIEEIDQKASTGTSLTVS